jgi:hypothetical protein
MQLTNHQMPYRTKTLHRAAPRRILRQCDEVDVSNEEQDKELSSFDDINIVLRLNASAAALAVLAQPVPAL